MNKETIQFWYEKKWSQALLDYLNSKDGSDYTAIKPIKNEHPTWADVDVKAISSSGKFPTLYLQLTRDDRFDTAIKIGKHNIPVFNCDNIVQAISEKEEKYRNRGKVFSQITLLIQGTLCESSRPFELTKELYNDCNKFHFKAIYYLSAPKISGSDVKKHYEDWFVTALKI